MAGERVMLRRALLAVGLTLLVSAPLFGQEWASKMFETTDHDFGTVARGARVEYSFVLSNIYLEDVHVASVRSSCGCTSPRIENPSLKTYENGAIVAAFNTAAFLGQHGATLTVTIDKPFYAEVQLHVKGYIRSDVVIEPGSVQIGDVEKGVPAVQKVMVNYSGQGDWKIVDVRGINTHLSVDMVQHNHQYGQVAYELTVHMDGKMPAGYINDHLMLVTNDEQGTQIPLLVEGRVLPGISVSPSSLFLGVVQPGQKVTKQLVVKGAKPFRIVSVTCKDKSFEFGPITDQTAKTLHLIPVTFLAGKDFGRVSQTIKIETDRGDTTPELAAYAVVAAP
jgi:hypothetical protein